MKTRNKLLALLLAMVMALGLMIPAAAAEGTAPADTSGKIVILHTNDVHCGIDQTTKDDAITGIGYAGVAAYKAEMGGGIGSMLWNWPLGLFLLLIRGGRVRYNTLETAK